MAESKADLSTVGGDGSRESGTGIGLAVAAEAKSAEANFLDAAAVAIDNLAVDDEEPRKRKAKPKVVEDEAEEEIIDDDDGEEEEEQGEEDAPEEDDQEEGEADADPDDEGEEGDEPDAKVSLRLNGKKASLEDILDHVGATVVVDGEDVDVTGSELIKGYQRGKDYSNKTTELKRMKDDLVPYNQMVAYAKTDPKFTEYVQSYFENGPYPELSQNPDLRTTDAELAELMDQNNAKYDADRANSIVKMRAEWQSKAGERQQVTQKANEDMKARYQGWAQEQVKTAMDAINNIGVKMGFEAKDGEYAAKSKQVLAYLEDSAFNEGEIAGQSYLSTTDARVAVMAYKASEYDRMVKEADAPRVTLGKKRKKLAPTRSQPAGSGKRRSTPKRQQRDSFRKASKDQTAESWVDALEKRLT